MRIVLLFLIAASANAAKAPVHHHGRKPSSASKPAATQSTSSPSVEDLAKRVAELEKSQSETYSTMDDGGGAKVSSFHNDHFTLGGFFEHAITGLGGPNTDMQINAGNAILGLNISAEYNRQMRFVSQFITGLTVPLQNEHNDPNATLAGLPRKREFKSFLYGALVAQAYIENVTTNGLHIQGGMGYVPFGHYFQIREPVLFIRRGGPQVLRVTSLVSGLWTGLHVFQEFRTKETRWGFNAYTFTEALDLKMPGIGVRAWLRPSNANLTFGISNQVAKQGVETYDALGLDMHWKIQRFTLTTEFINQFSGRGPWSAYVEPSYSLNGDDWIVYAFGDFSDSPKNLTITLPDPYRKWEYGAGVNWLPVSYTRLRAGLTFNDYVSSSAVKNGQDRDYISIDISAGVAF